MPHPVELIASTDGRLLLGSGEAFDLKGVVWGGAQMRLDRAPYGLDKHPMEYYAHMLRAHGFNSVKLLFSHAAVLGGKKISHASGEGDKREEGHIDAEHTLFGLSYVEMLLSIATTLHNHGMLVFLGAAFPTGTDPLEPPPGLWYTEEITSEKIIIPTFVDTYKISSSEFIFRIEQVYSDQSSTS